VSEVNVIARTQRVIVNPVSRTVNVVNVGPSGPAGPQGLPGDPGVSGGGEINDRWIWQAASTVSPGTVAATRCAVNNDAPSAANRLLIHKESANANIDYGATIASLKLGDHIYLQQKTDATRFHRYEITGLQSLQGGTTWNIPVITDSGSPTGTEPANNAEILVAFQFAGGLYLPVGGTSDQVLAKDTSVDGDASWRTMSSIAAPIRIPTRDETNATYTPDAGDENVMIRLNNASEITVSLPSNATRSIPVNAETTFVWWGVGAVTFVAGSGATVDGTPGLKLRARYSAATAKKMSTNAWLVYGDLSA
jgi:hypothetical protein